MICSRLGSMQEIVKDGYTGLHFSPGDSADLATKVEWALTQPGELAIMGHAARQIRKAVYRESNYTKLLEIYEKTIAQ